MIRAGCCAPESLSTQSILGSSKEHPATAVTLFRSLAHLPLADSGQRAWNAARSNAA
jgi:hypothetical protein